MTKIEKREAELRRPAVQRIKLALPEAILIRHEEVRNSGTPDLTVTALGMTTWWEFKHGTPLFSSRGIQEYVCMGLAREGFCRYILFREDGLERETMIVHPRSFHERLIYGIVPEERVLGFSNEFIAGYVIRVHERAIKI